VDAALLDVNLNGESIGTAAEMLHGRGIPIVFTTGYSDIHLLAPVLRGLPMLQKPLSPPDIIARLQQVTSKPLQGR
jgi:CheY-like chemotaxis protein